MDRIHVVTWENDADLLEILEFLNKTSHPIANIAVIEQAPVCQQTHLFTIACLLEWIRNARIPFEVIHSDDSIENDSVHKYIRGLCS